MRCEEVQEYLAERLAGSLSDRLSESLQSYVRTHMRGCTECCEELEDFEEMQSVLRSIPVEPCDTNTMRARFNLLIGAKEEKPQTVRTPRSWTLPRPNKTVIAVFAGVVVLAVAALAVRQVLKRDGASSTVASTPAQSSKPAAAAVRTGAMSGQIRASNGEDLRRVRVAVVAVPNSGVPSSEIAVESSADGRYRLENIPAGRYYVLATSIDSPTYYPGTPDVSGAKVVTVRAGAVLEGIDFTRIATASQSTSPAVTSVSTSSVSASISGRVLLEDGSDVSDSLPLGEIAWTAVGSSKIDATTVVRLDGNGRFNRSIAADEYRFRVVAFSQDYVVRSMTAGASDLLKENLKVTPDTSVSVAIRVARRSDVSTGRILGTVIDALTNAPAASAQGDQVMLCCFPSGPAERISTPVRANGTFEFTGVPSGVYTAELRGSRELLTSNPSIVVTSTGVSGLKLLSASQLVTIEVTIRHENGERLPFKPDTSIVFTAAKGEFRTVASHFVGNLFRITLPAGSSYSVSVSNIAAGYSIQSVRSGIDGNRTDLLHGGLFTANSDISVPARILVTLSKN